MNDSNLVLAGKLASMTFTAGDVEIRGPIMTVPIRDLDGALAVFGLRHPWTLSQG